MVAKNCCGEGTRGTELEREKVRHKSAKCLKVGL